jgi:hypothetical protein
MWGLGLPPSEFLVCILNFIGCDLEDVPQWPKKHLLLPLLENKWKDPEMTPHLTALIKWVSELR